MFSSEIRWICLTIITSIAGYLVYDYYHTNISYGKMYSCVQKEMVWYNGNCIKTIEVPVPVK